MALAVVLLHEPLRRCNSPALSSRLPAPSSSPSPGRAISAIGEALALLLPLAGALIRGVVPPIVKLGLEVWPSPLWACLIGYIMSSLVVLAVQRIRNGSFVADAPSVGPVLVRRYRHQQRS